MNEALGEVVKFIAVRLCFLFRRWRYMKSKYGNE